MDSKHPPSFVWADGVGTTPRVAIIGAGLGGIATAVGLVRAGIRSFTIFEKSSGPGGTWWDNRYPGAECDVPSHLYSYSFRLQDWTRTHARQPEIQAYVESVIDEYGLRPHLTFDAEVCEAVWDEEAHRYLVRTTAGEQDLFNVVVSAVGLLNVPRYPEWPGLDQFEGPAFHTARWEHEHDLRGKRVAVVGAGATAAQVVPAVAKVAGHVLTFQREPAWVMPKGDHDFTDEDIRRRRAPLRKRIERAKIMWNLDKVNRAAEADSKAAERLDQACRAYLRETFAARPDLLDLLTPDYPVRCKRIVISSDFYPALLRENVELVPRSVTRVTRTGIVDAAGIEHQVDAIVLATGFQPWNFLSSLEVTGRAGRTLHGVWGEEPEAFLGLTVAGFPNFYMLYGPNTNGGVVSFTLERQASFVSRQVRRMARTGATAIETRRLAFEVYNRVLSRKLAGMATWEADCNNYYHSSTGKNVTQWPWTHLRYWVLTKALRVPCTYGRRLDRIPDVGPTAPAAAARRGVDAEALVP